MRVVARSSWWSAVVACAFVVCLSGAAAGSAAVATLPNPCTLLAKVHPEHTFGHGKTVEVTHKKLQKYGSGRYASVACSETVGTQPVSLSLSGAPPGGFGGIVKPTSSHPSGLGVGDTLIVGTAAGKGTPVDIVLFHRASVYADLSANGASPALLTSFARQVYKQLP
jgi:hypothetical protein